MRVLLLYSVVAAGLATTSPATIYIETGDAGDSPGTAQIAAGSGPLTSILGQIDSSADDDIYRIRISDPASFSASTNNTGTQLSVDGDTILFLFDEFGFGIVANDDDPEDIDSLKAALPAGSFSGPPGTYLLAISIFRNVPRNAFAEEIFPTLPVQVRGANSLIGRSIPARSRQVRIVWI